MAGPEKIIVDGSVFVLAEVSTAARTGVYFLLRDLMRALSARDDVDLRFFIQGSFDAGVNVRGLFPKAVSALGLHRYALGYDGWRMGVDKVSLLSGFIPIRSDLHTVPNLSLYQMLYDLSGHACAELGGTNAALEAQIVGGLGKTARGFCISQSTRNDVHRYFGIPLERLSVIYPALRSDFLSGRGGATAGADARRSIGIPPTASYILALSTLEPRKNLVTSIKAFSRVVEALPEQDIRFVVAGVDGWGDQISIINSLPGKVTSRISVTGYVADEVVPALISDALCLVYPSLYEGFGLPALEAMTCGTPVIVSNRASLPEIVGTAGVIVDPFDDQTIAQTIVGWARSEDERRRWADLGRAQAAKFNWEASVEKILEIMRTRTADKTPA